MICASGNSTHNFVYLRTTRKVTHALVPTSTAPLLFVFVKFDTYSQVLKLMRRRCAAMPGGQPNSHDLGRYVGSGVNHTGDLKRNENQTGKSTTSRHTGQAGDARPTGVAGLAENDNTPVSGVPI